MGYPWNYSLHWTWFSTFRGLLSELIMFDCTLAAVPVLPVTLMGMAPSEPRFKLLPMPPEAMLLLELTADVKVPILLD